MSLEDCSIDNVKDISMPCAVVKGLERSGFFYDRSEFLQATGVTYDTTEMYLKTFVMPVGAEGYKFTLQPGQVKRAVAGAASDAGETNFVPTITIQEENNATGNLNVASLAGREWIVIVEQKEKGTDNLAAFEVHGLKAGLKATAPAIEEGMNKWTVPLTNMDDSQETAPHIFFTTDETSDSYIADLAYLEATLTETAS